MRMKNVNIDEQDAIDDMRPGHKFAVLGHCLTR